MLTNQSSPVSHVLVTVVMVRHQSHVPAPVSGHHHPHHRHNGQTQHEQQQGGRHQVLVDHIPLILVKSATEYLIY